MSAGKPTLAALRQQAALRAVGAVIDVKLRSELGDDDLAMAALDRAVDLLADLETLLLRPTRKTAVAA